MKVRLFQAFLIILFLYTAKAGAVPWEKPTDAEIAVLPPYCADRLHGIVSSKKWLNSLGPIYLDIHHYCMGLNFLNRYYKSSNPQDREYLIQTALGNINYVIIDKNKNSALMPEIYFNKGRVLTLYHKDAEAAEAYLQAIQLKPDYAAPYVALANFYVRIEKKQDALKILQEGLQHIPSSNYLARRYQELGGKLPLPNAPAAAPDSSQVGTQTLTPDKIDKEVFETTPAADSKTTDQEPIPTAVSNPDKIGSPSNPWCRFCTDDPTPSEK